MYIFRCPCASRCVLHSCRKIVELILLLEIAKINVEEFKAHRLWAAAVRELRVLELIEEIPEIEADQREMYAVSEAFEAALTGGHVDRERVEESFRSLKRERERERERIREIREERRQKDAQACRVEFRGDPLQIEKVEDLEMVIEEETKKLGEGRMPRAYMLPFQELLLLLLLLLFLFLLLLFLLLLFLGRQRTPVCLLDSFACCVWLLCATCFLYFADEIASVQ